MPEKTEDEINVRVRGIDGYVDSFTWEGVVYLVWYDKGLWTCDCEDGVYRGHKTDHKDCKHICLFKKKIKNICEVGE